MNWQIVGRVGYLGKHRDEKFKEWDSGYGEHNWQLAWIWGTHSLNFYEECAIYEDAYFAYLLANKSVLCELAAEAKDIYDDNPSNVLSGCNYYIQETAHTHMQDIAIRRVMQRLGTDFCGDKLIQIRQEKGIHPLSMTLSPGKIPFHCPDMIEKPWLTGWWDPGTVECQYQSNRVLQILKG